MARYQVTLDGKTFVLEGDHPPSEAEARAAIGEHTAAAAPAPAAPADRFAHLRSVAEGAPASELWQRVKDHPIETGAMAGSMLATGGASVIPSMLRAAVGAAGGAGYGIVADAAQHGPSKSAADDIATMAKAGGAAAVGEGVGRGLAAGATTAAKKVYKTALRPSMGLQKEFGDVAEAGLRGRVPVSEGGLTKVEGKLSLSADKVRKLVADAEQAGAAPVTTREVAGEFGDVFQQGRRQAQLGKPDPRPAVIGRLKAFDARNPNGITLTRAQELKGEAQDLASRAYRAADRGGPMTDLSAESDKAMARGLRKGIETRVPEVGPLNEQSQELIGVKRALEDATRRNVGIGGIRAMLGDMIPSVASVGAIGADRVGRSAATPAAFRAMALLAMLGGQ